MDWRTTYPTMATMMEASFETLCTWLQKLPPPVNDVERAVSRRMIDRRNELLGQKVRANAPEFADTVSTASILAPIADATKGSVRRVETASGFALPSIVPVRMNDTLVPAFTAKPLMPSVSPGASGRVTSDMPSSRTTSW